MGRRVLAQPSCPSSHSRPSSPADASPLRQVRRRLHGPPRSSRAASSRAPAPASRFPTGRRRYGWNMFTFPPSKWVGGILYEHGHRLIASTVGFLTIILAVWLWLRGAAPLDEVARRRRARRGHRAGRARRPHGAVLPARRDLDRARRASRKSSSASRSRSRSSRRRAGSPAMRPAPATPVDDRDAAPRRRRPPRSLIYTRSSSARRCGTPARAWRFLTSR